MAKGSESRGLLRPVQASASDLEKDTTRAFAAVEGQSDTETGLAGPGPWILPARWQD